MSKLQIKQGDIFSADEQAICHQCNCVSQYAQGLAKSIFDMYPWANVYKKNIFRNPGSVVLERNPESLWKFLNTELNKIGIHNFPDRCIVHIFGQVYPGKPKYKKGRDSAGQRIKYFKKALETIKHDHYLNAPGIGRDFFCDGYAFPYKIGCNRGGGDWNTYLTLIEKFADSMDVPVSIYKL